MLVLLGNENGCGKQARLLRKLNNQEILFIRSLNLSTVSSGLE